MYLNCKTYFSYRYGTFSTDNLVKEGVEVGASAMALTNINNTSDLWDFYELCTQAGIKPVLGCEIRNEDELLYILIAKNNDGIAIINKFLSDHLQPKVPFPVQPHFDSNVWIIYPLGKRNPDELMLHELIGVQPSEVNHLYGVDTSSFPTNLLYDSR